MKLKATVLAILFVASSLLVLTEEAYAAKKSRKAKAGVPVSTEHVFDGAMVNGRYQSAGEAVAIVETEKQMNELIGGRRDFKDRLAVERARLKKTAASGQ